MTPELALEILHRRKWVALVVFLTGLAAAVTVMLSLPDLYRASATVLVERQQISEAFVRSSVTAELETRIQTIHQRVTSRGRLADVIRNLNLYPELRDVEPLEAIVERMRRDITPLQLRGVEQASGRTATIAFTVGYSGRDPRTVAEVTNALVGFYIAENTSSRERQAAKTAEFIGAQLAEVKAELLEQERRTNEFTLQHTNELPQQLEANLAAIDRLYAQLRLNGEYQLRVMERRERLEEERAGAGAAVQVGETPAQQLGRLQRQLAELRGRFSDEYPDVRRVAGEVAALERQIASAASRAMPTEDRSAQALRDADSELRSLKEEEASLRRTILGYETRISSAPRRQQEIDQLSRGHDMTLQRYQALLKQYEEAQLAATLEQSDDVEQFRVLDPAIPPRHPVAPSRMWLGLMGLVLSLGLAAGAVVALEKLDTTFHSVDDLQAFADVPLLATIRRIDTRAAARRRRVRAVLVGVSVVAWLAMVVAGTYYVAGGNEQLVRMTARGGV